MKVKLGSAHQRTLARSESQVVNSCQHFLVVWVNPKIEINSVSISIRGSLNKVRLFFGKNSNVFIRINSK